MAEDINKTLEALGSLDNLHDIIIPDPIGFFPLASGWYMVFLLLVTYAIHFSVKRYKNYQKDLYRRDALERILSFERSKSSALELISLAKIVGFSAYGREEIAKLSGESWWEFMELNSKVKIPQTLKSEIDKLLYRSDYQLEETTYDEIAGMVKIWIETHRVVDDD